MLEANIAYSSLYRYDQLKRGGVWRHSQSEKRRQRLDIMMSLYAWRSRCPASFSVVGKYLKDLEDLETFEAWLRERDCNCIKQWQCCLCWKSGLDVRRRLLNSPDAPLEQAYIVFNIQKLCGWPGEGWKSQSTPVPAPTLGAKFQQFILILHETPLVTIDTALVVDWTGHCCSHTPLAAAPSLLLSISGRSVDLDVYPFGTRFLLVHDHIALFPSYVALFFS